MSTSHRLAASILYVLSLVVLLAGTASAQEDVIPLEDTWRLFRGRSAPSKPSTAWREPGFDDSRWEYRPAGFGYGDEDDTTVLSDMQFNYLTVYIRKRFVLPELSSITELVLEIDYDDGFIAYINGREVARAGMGARGEEFQYNHPARKAREPGTPERFRIARSVLKSGDNVIAIEGHNVAMKSSDFSLSPRLELTGRRFIRGDADGGGRVDITDGIRILRHTFFGVGPLECVDAADADDSGRIEITDAIRVFNVLFLGEGTVPPPGIRECGFDPTPDGLASCGANACS